MKVTKYMRLPIDTSVKSWKHKLATFRRIRHFLPQGADWTTQWWIELPWLFGFSFGIHVPARFLKNRGETADGQAPGEHP